MPRKSKISQTPADPKRPRHNGELFVEGIPLTTKCEFKATCARQGKAMRDVIIDLMRAYVSQNG